MAAALVASVVVVAALILRSAGTYTVTAVFQNAGQIVRGNEARVASVPAGKVTDIRLGPDGQAELVIELEPRFSPLHRGTTATVRAGSLAGIANRSVALTPGPDNAPEIPDGGRIEAEDTTSAVDLDQVLNALDPRTTAELREVVRGGARAFRGRGRQANAGIEALNPALSASSDAIHEVVRDQPALERLIVRSADVVSTLAERREALSGGTAAAAAATRAIAGERDALAETLGLLPDALRQSNTTLVNLRATLRDARPAIREARPVARGLSRLLPRVAPASRALRREIPPLRALVRRPRPDNDLLDLLASLPPLERAGVPVVRDLVEILRQAQPVLDEARPYTPELTAGLFAGFGGNAGGYYDANGHYARISFIAGPLSASNSANLVPLPTDDLGTGFRSGVVKRCPGGAVYPAADGSSPYTEGGRLPCDPALSGRRP